MSHFLKKFKNFFLRILQKPHNMHRHSAEQYYFSIYWHYMFPFLEKCHKILDIGCQKGRFTIPLIELDKYVVATDIFHEYGQYIQRYIKQNMPQKEHLFTYRCESINQTLENLTPNTFDAVLCLELLYNLPSGENYLSGLGALVKPEGYLITSHRTAGYYIYRYLKERDYTALLQIMQNSHPYYNWQTAEQLQHIYQSIGFRVLGCYPIGMFSGFGRDPFAVIANPARLSKKWKDHLFEAETAEQMKALFINSARYIFIIGQKM